MKTLEDKEIRGITVKQAWIYVSGIVAVVFSLAGMWFGLSHKIEVISANKQELLEMKRELRAVQDDVLILKTRKMNTYGEDK